MLFLLRSAIRVRSSSAEAETALGSSAMTASVRTSLSVPVVTRLDELSLDAFFHVHEAVGGHGVGIAQGLEDLFAGGLHRFALGPGKQAVRVCGNRDPFKTAR